MLYFSRWKTILIWLTVLIGLAYAAPNVLPRSWTEGLPSWLPDKSVTLGLDLQGGSYILLEVDRASLVKERLQSVQDEVRQLLRQKRIGYSAIATKDHTISVRLRDPAQASDAQSALEQLTQPISSGLMSGGSVAEVELAQPQAGVITATLTDQGIAYRVSTAVTQSIEVVRRRVDELGTTEPIIQRQGADRIMVQVPGLGDPKRLKELLNQTAKLTFQLVDQSENAETVAKGGRVPPGDVLLYTNDKPARPILVKRQVMVSGENLTDAQPGFDQQTNEPVVNIRFDSQGAQRFGRVTQANVGKPFAIVLDDKVLSAPVIRTAILGGQAQISGSFTVQSANDLAVLLRAGALPATLNIIEERTVGPGLGADSIDAGEMAGVIGAVAVVVFMLAAYGFLGVIANIALAANLILLFAVLTVIGATLTLPGIAGIVLTLGMAVDSNVLIYERIRDERRQGRSVVQAIDAGFQKALATILDANITTLIAAVVLFFLGSGPVRGFAVTLAIGILTTVFTAFTLTRWLVAAWVRRRRPKELPKGYLRLVPEVTKIPFMKVRLKIFGVSMALCIASIVSLFAIGPNFGIDFTGGTLIEVQAKQGAADTGDIRTQLTKAGIADPQVQEFGTQNEALIRIGAFGEVSDSSQQKLVDTASQALSQTYDIRRTEVVGPTVSGELAWAAIIGVLASLVAILVYVWLRFEWQFALGAIIATVNDVILTLGFITVTQLDVSLSTVAAILTIVGYSLNDTVVIYDRVRENLRRFKKMPLGQLLDLSDNEMLSRTTMTSATTVLALAALFVFGGEVIRSFVASMLFGVIIGTFSSIFVAAPVLVFFNLRSTDAAEAARAADLDEKKKAAEPGQISAGQA
ncbi:protein translocase subunit SecDF [Jiella sp. MQZ9-1]|uniref:Multifunctional fusion protein n=1 Tax=Jiella flava TaxID=2816857 RepID=A0A939FXR8_9HYPH|nr:protein translocase subunit SecDF [Jiella flava]MBO0663432.1 protein translocase subunit SecDF [Jiella flava]MCD2472008.1 protein translocase subunit SecDF [Jiella flava]